MKSKINLVLAGCGLLYPEEFGALKAILEKYDVVNIAGVSGGAIIASLYAKGNTIETIENTIYKFNTEDKQLFDFDMYPLDAGYGIIKGKIAEQFFKQVFRDLKFKDTTTPLTVFATNAEQLKPFVFDSKTTPNSDVYKAVRASMSIPFLFNYYEYGKLKLIDGGVYNNLPVKYYANKNDFPTMGIMIEPTIKTKGQPINSFVDYVGNVVELMIQSTVNEHVKGYKNCKIIKLPNVGYNWFAKDVLSKKRIEKLIQTGFESCQLQI